VRRNRHKSLRGAAIVLWLAFIVIVSLNELWLFTAFGVIMVLVQVLSLRRPPRPRVRPVRPAEDVPRAPTQVFDVHRPGPRERAAARRSGRRR
jgi:hypothetical protein